MKNASWAVLVLAGCAAHPEQVPASWRDPPDRLYDAYTGPVGMLVAYYLARLVPGMQSFPVVMK